MLVASLSMRMRAGSTTHAHMRPLVILLASSFLFLAFLATARSAHAADGRPALETAAMAPPAADGAPAPLQDAVTDQTSSATATVADPDQSNLVVIIRINSPGDDVVSQTNVISVGATSANGSSTNQDQSAGASPAPAAALVEGSAAPVGAAPASAPAASPQPVPSTQQDDAPAVADRGKVILAAYGRSSAGPQPDAAAPAPRNRQVEPASRGAEPARAEARAPSSSAPVVAPQASPHATHAASLARVDRHPASSAGATPQQRLSSSLGGGGRTAAATALAADPAKGSDFGDFALAALVAGIAACALFAYLPRLRNTYARLR